jgi:hypothetical protein
MEKKQGQPGDDVSKAPESGTERDDSGSAPPERGAGKAGEKADAPSQAPEER